MLKLTYKLGGPFRIVALAAAMTVGYGITNEGTAGSILPTVGHGEYTFGNIEERIKKSLKTDLATIDGNQSQQVECSESSEKKNLCMYTFVLQTLDVWRNVADSYNNLGYLYNLHGQTEKALHNYGIALSYYRTARNYLEGFKALDPSYSKKATEAAELEKLVSEIVTQLSAGETKVSMDN